MLHTVSSAESVGPRELSDELERGRIVFFPRCPFPLPPEHDLCFLREELAVHLKQKNPSFHPEADRMYGVRGTREFRERAASILREHYRETKGFLTRILPEFAKGWRLGTSSFRPLQEKGRAIRAHASSEWLHVDANAYGATHGDRILRFFVNVHPSEDREWISKGTFPELFRRHGAAAGIGGRSLTPGVWNRLYSGALRGLERIGLRSARLIDTSPYDRQMRRFHNWMKDSREFQEDPDGLRRFRFPPGSAWMVLTDMVSHACVSGRHAFIDTFLIPLSACRMPELSPFRILAAEVPPSPGNFGWSR